MDNPINFYKFRETDMLNTFGIKRVSNCQSLDYWLQTNDVLSDFENQVIADFPGAAHQ